MRRRRRQGFSLLEVLLATAMLIGAAVVLMELASIGNRHAASARELTKSQLLCQAKLNEIACGTVALETASVTPLESDPLWVSWVEVTPSSQPGVVLVEVGVAFQPAPNVQRYRFTLTRWMRNPETELQTPGDVLPGSTPPAMAQGGVGR